MPFSNPIAAGNSLARPQFESPNFVPGVSGWAIFRNGNAQFNSLTLTGTTFDGNNYILNTSGFFLYSGAPANGNLSASIAPAAGTDGFGNSYFAGIVSYSGNRYSQLVGGDLLLGDTASTGSTAVVETSSTGGQTYIAGSTKTSADIAAPWLALFSAAGSANGVVQAVIASGTTQPVALTTALAEIQGSLAVSGAITATGGTAAAPILITTDTWHSLGTLAGYTVALAAYRLTPDGELELAISLTGGGANAASVNFSVTLPNTGYRPVSGYQFGLTGNRALVAGDSIGRCGIASTGIVTVVTPANNSNTWVGVGRIPLNL